VYDLIAIGAGAGGLVSAKQSARRGAKSAMISEHLAGGGRLVGCFHAWTNLIFCFIHWMALFSKNAVLQYVYPFQLPYL
jgi:phytoene dehydrogenase-like protein